MECADTDKKVFRAKVTVKRVPEMSDMENKKIRGMEDRDG